MQVVCNKCNAKYRIGDDKLIGRDRIRLKCKKCDNIIEAKVKNIADEDTSNLFSTSSTESITSSVSGNNDIFEDNLFSGDKNEFSFEDVKKTLVLDRENISENKSESGPEPKFKSSFQMDFSDKTSQQNLYMDNSSGSQSSSAAISFETTQQISVDKFNEYQKNKDENSLLSPKNNIQQNKLNPLDNRTKDKFEDISKEFKTQKVRGEFGILKFIFIIIFIISILFAFVLYKNNWALDFNNLPKMINIAFNNSPSSKQSVKGTVKEQNKSLKEQFFIDTKKIKTKLFKFSKRKHDKRYIFIVSGEIKNIDSQKKSLTTIKVKVNSMLDKKTILQKRVYAGNTFTKKEIMKAKKEEVLDAEYLQSGKNGSNWGVLPNKTIPFMVVFYLDKKINLKEVRIKIEVESTQ